MFFRPATATSYRIEIKFKLVLQVKLHENGLNTENYEINSLLIEFSTMNNFFPFSCTVSTFLIAALKVQFGLLCAGGGEGIERKRVHEYDILYSGIVTHPIERR